MLFNSENKYLPDILTIIENLESKIDYQPNNKDVLKP